MSYQSAIKDLVAERRMYQRRLFLSLFIVACVFVLLLARYFSLQYFQHQEFVTQSDRNRIHTLPVSPRRGLIYDRNGILLAENQPSYSLAITKERVEDLDELLIDLQQLFDIDERSIDKFKQRLRRRTPYQAVPLKFKLDEDEISRFSVNRYRLDGVEIQAQLVRHYPQGEMLAHVLGYVGRINASEQEDIFADEQRRVEYAATDYIGKSGVEKHYEDLLHGHVGSQYVETNAHGRVLRVLNRIDPFPGEDLVLTIDARMQAYVHQLMDGKRGSVVALDSNSGEVLAMVSTPSFDANWFVGGISSEKYSQLRDSIDLPLFNRSLQGQYPPGSTIKPILGLAGLHYDVVTNSTLVADPGWYQLPNDDRYYRDWKREGHAASINLYGAVVESCDVYFYDLAYKLGIDRIQPFLAHFGLGEQTGIDSTSERSGLLPSRMWKRAMKRMPWFPGETLNVGIGQGYLLATPMQLAVATATLANKGVKPDPHLLKSPNRNMLEADSFDDELFAQDKQARATDSASSHSPDDTQLVDKYDVDSAAEVDSQHWNSIHYSMEGVVHSAKGTARGIAQGLDYRIAGKTGTAQVIGIAQGEEYDEEAIAERQRDHALFVGFAPLRSPKIAVAVIVENGGSGSSAAAPIARKVFDWYANNQQQKSKPVNEGAPLYASRLPPHVVNEG